MRTPGSVIAVIVVVGCGSSGDRKDPDKYEFDLRIGKHATDPGRYAQDPPQQIVKPDVDPVPPAPTPKAKIDPACVASGTVEQIKVAADKVYACVDTTSDGVADECATWSRSSGKFLEVAPMFAVEDDDTKPDVADVPDADAEDPRVTTDSDSVTACPDDRACMKLMPRIKDGDTLDSARSDANHRALAVLITEGDSRAARVELWDLEAGRLRTRARLAGPEADQTYAFAVHAYGDSFVTLAKRSSDDRAVVTLFGLDGTRRVALGGGSRTIDSNQLIEAPGQLALLDLAAGKAPTVYLHAIPSGATIGRFTIPASGDDDSASLVKMDHGMIGVTQWKADSGNNDGHLRVDVIDSKSASSRAFVAPGC